MVAQVYNNLDKKTCFFMYFSFLKRISNYFMIL